MPVVSHHAGSPGVLLEVPVDEGLIVDLIWYNTLTAKPNLPPRVTPLGEDRSLL